MPEQFLLPVNQQALDETMIILFTFLIYKDYCTVSIHAPTQDATKVIAQSP
jgi:hypothetical protein